MTEKLKTVKNELARREQMLKEIKKVKEEVKEVKNEDEVKEVKKKHK